MIRSAPSRVGWHSAEGQVARAVSSPVPIEQRDLALCAAAYTELREYGCKRFNQVDFCLDFEKVFVALDPLHQELLILAAEGCTQADMAQELGISLRTVNRWCSIYAVRAPGWNGKKPGRKPKVGRKVLQFARVEA